MKIEFVGYFGDIEQVKRLANMSIDEICKAFSQGFGTFQWVMRTLTIGDDIDETSLEYSSYHRWAVRRLDNKIEIYEK